MGHPQHPNPKPKGRSIWKLEEIIKNSAGGKKKRDDPHYAYLEIHLPHGVRVVSMMTTPCSAPFLVIYLPGAPRGIAQGM